MNIIQIEAWRGITGRVLESEAGEARLALDAQAAEWDLDLFPGVDW